MAPPDSPSRRVRVLIADDHKIFAEAMRDTMSADDRLDVVGLAHDGREAVDLLAELQRDIVVMDVQMPVLDGIEATRMIREAHPRTRVIILTAGGSEDAMRRARDAGAAAFVTKEQSLAELMESFFEIASLAIVFGGDGERVAATTG